MFSLTPGFEQMSFTEQIKEVNDLTSRNPLTFLQLLKEHIDLPTLIPQSFYNSYYASKTNNRDYPLESILAVALLMHFFSFASASNFITLLYLSPIVREFCRLPDGRVPDDSVISKFKTTFVNELKLFFENLSSEVMNIFTEFNTSLPDDSPLKDLNEVAIYDTSGLKPKVKENNPKTLETEIRRQCNYKKYLESKGTGEDFNPYAAAYKNLPKQAFANEDIRLDYANGHFGYFYKFGTLTNGFGIPLHIDFLDKTFFNNLPNEYNSVEEQKYVFDNASLKPVLSSFYKRIGNNRFSTFLGDSEFDSYDNYGFLNELGFSKVLIPINGRNAPVSNESIPIDCAGIPCCPKDLSRPFIYNGSCKGKNRSLRYKFVCPDSRKVGGKWICDCKDKCRDTKSTVTKYTYPSGDLRVYSGVHRGSDEWRELYKIRTIIEREFSSMKSHPALERPRSYNCDSMRADVYLNAATKLLTVMLAFALGRPEYMRNLNKLLKAAA